MNSVISTGRGSSSDPKANSLKEVIVATISSVSESYEVGRAVKVPEPGVGLEYTVIEFGLLIPELGISDILNLNAPVKLDDRAELSIIHL
ncbi:hypothetical protein ASZ90_004846 [hydrocarbon metagenome]|uniref:Uncharacterized protein n=1 Tax=hydrocarbon metagenome TaxID=938273 RepID=A0A0W8FWW1_9ZZZZ